MGLKEDAKFVRNITMGALGARRVAEDLSERGHEIIELERYAMANKRWATRIKRLRLVDLLCVSCGRRFESKAKAKMQVVLSDSKQAGRGWSDGMRPDDVFAFLAVKLDGAGLPLEIGNPIYLETASLSRVTPNPGQLKSARDGSERDVFWPISVATCPGLVTRVRGGKVTIKPEGARVRTLGSEKYSSLVSEGDWVEEGAVLASAAATAREIKCAGPVWDLHEAIRSDDQVEVFGAVKAAGILGERSTGGEIRAIVDDDLRDMRLRVEALGALARLGDRGAVGRLADLDDGDGELEMQMERVLVLSELVELKAATVSLARIAREMSRPDEIRAAAVWGLGATWHNQFSECWSFAFDESESVRRHAQAGLGSPGPAQFPLLVTALGKADQAPLAAAVLARTGSVPELIAALSEALSRDWALQALGQIDPAEVMPLLAEVSAEDAGVLDALWRRNFYDFYNEPENLTEIRFIARQSLRAPELVSD